MPHYRTRVYYIISFVVFFTCEEFCIIYWFILQIKARNFERVEKVNFTINVQLFSDEFEYFNAIKTLFTDLILYYYNIFNVFRNWEALFQYHLRLSRIISVTIKQYCIWWY